MPVAPPPRGRRIRVATRPSLAPKFRFIAHRAFICTGVKARVGAQGEGDFTLAVFRRPGFVAAGFLGFTAGRNLLVAQLELNAAIRNVYFDQIAVFDDGNVAAACCFWGNVADREAGSAPADRYISEWRGSVL